MKAEGGAQEREKEEEKEEVGIPGESKDLGRRRRRRNEKFEGTRDDFDWSNLKHTKKKKRRRRRRRRR